MTNHRRAKGWHVEIDHPDGYTHRPMVVGSPQQRPSVNDLHELTIPVRRDEKWFDTALEEAPMRVWKDGTRLPIDHLESVDIQAGETILRGRGGLELTERVEVEYDSKKVHLAAEDLINTHTSYTANVDSPDVATVTGSQVQSADTNSELQSNLDSLANTDPFIFADSQLKLAQSCWAKEAEDSSVNKSGTFITRTTEGWSGDTVISLDALGEYVEYSFNVDYRVPADIACNIRMGTSDRDADSVTDGHKFVISIDGTTVMESTSGWGHFKKMFWRPASGSFALDPANNPHKVRIEIPNTSGALASQDIAVDALCAHDNRFDYTFSDNRIYVEEEDTYYLEGPELYPDAFDAVFQDASFAYTITGGSVESTFDNTSGKQAVALSNDSGSTWYEASNTSSYDTDFDSGGPSIRWRATLSRYGGYQGNQNLPMKGTKGQKIDDYTLFADYTETPLVVNTAYDDSLLNILQELADLGDFVFEYRQNDTSPSVEWCQVGQRSASSDPSIAEYDLTKSTKEVVEKAVIYGASVSVRDERFISNHGTAVALNNSHLQESREIVYDPSGGTTFERGTDYTMNYQLGEITTLSGGSMTDSTEYAIDYPYQTYGEYVQDGVSDPSVLVRNVSDVTTADACKQLATHIVSELSTSQYSARITVPNTESDWSVVDDIALPELPTDDTRLHIKTVENTPQRTELELGNARSLEDIISDITTRINSVTRKV